MLTQISSDLGSHQNEDETKIQQDLIHHSIGCGLTIHLHEGYVVGGWSIKSLIQPLLAIQMWK